MYIVNFLRILLYILGEGLAFGGKMVKKIGVVGDSIAHGFFSSFYPSNRDVYFDNIKGKLILLVILGHFLELNLSDTVFRFFYTFLYSFVMPVFVFISGLFFKPKIKTVIKFFVLYNIFQVFLFLLYGYCSGTSGSFHSFFIPIWTLWYLLCLSYWYLTTMLLEKLGCSEYYLLFFSIILALLSGFTDINYFLGLQRACAYFVCFAMGVCIKKERLKNYVQAFSVRKECVFFVSGMLILFFIYKENFLPGAFYNSYPFSYFPSYSKVFLLGVRLLQYVLSFVFGMFLLKNTSSCKNFYTFCGYYCLWIYLIHTVILYYYKLYVYFL